MSKDIIVLENIEKSFRSGKTRLKILNNVSLNCRQEEFISITGSSGAGKSTLLHLMGLLLTPDKGEIYIDGISASGMNDRKRSGLRNEKIGFIFQSYHLLPEFNAVENIALPLLLKGKNSSKAKKEALTLLEKTNLSDRAAHFPSQLSGGEQQRISILRSLINRPAVILADEPTGNLDTENSALIMKMLKDFTVNEGLSLIMVTHNEDLAARASRKIIMKDGCLVV